MPKTKVNAPVAPLTLAQLQAEKGITPTTSKGRGAFTPTNPFWDCEYAISDSQGAVLHQGTYHMRASGEKGLDAEFRYINQRGDVTYTRLSAGILSPNQNAG